MAERIVVCFGFMAAGEADDHVGRARALVRRAEAFGGALCTWGLSTISFSFQVDDIEEAIGFVTGQDGQKHIEDFSVGIAQGELTMLGERKGSVELGFGPALIRAFSLADGAQPAEVLVDFDILSVHPIDLVPKTNLAESRGVALRGFPLDTEKPWRHDAERTLDRLVEPALVGRNDALSTLDAPPGMLAIIRAEAGTGGSRLLAACAAESQRVLMLQPTGSGLEPLGSIRRALARQRALGKIPSLNPTARKTLAGLIAGDGTTVADVASLLGAWLKAPKGSGLLLVDDANELDPSSLEAIAAAVLEQANPFRTVVRLDAGTPLSAVLAPIPPGPEVEIEPLTSEDTEQLAAAWLNGRLRDDARSIWARRADGYPLALGEALAESLVSGELTWADNQACPRSSHAANIGPLPARVWIGRRFAFLSPSARSTLFAVAILGGDASVAALDSVLKAAADVPTETDVELDVLTRTCWVVRTESKWVALPSRTHQRVVLEALPEGQVSAWHRAASMTLEEREGRLARAEAAWHAARAGDGRRAARLAREAAEAAQKAGLTAASEALLAFARSQEPHESESPKPGEPASSLAATLVARGRERIGHRSHAPVETPSVLTKDIASDSEIPVELPTGEIEVTVDFTTGDDFTASMLIDESISESISEEIELDLVDVEFTDEEPESEGLDAIPLRRARRRRPTDEGPIQSDWPVEKVPLIKGPAPKKAPLLESKAAQSMDTIPVAPLNGEAEAQLEEIGPASVEDMASSFPVLGREALLSGDETALERWVQEAGAMGKRDRLVQRVRAVAALQRGEGSEALKVLRTGCEQVADLGPVERSRSHLAYAVGLAQTGKLLEALVEALEALARSREAKDRRGEQACALFLHKLYETAGHKKSAAVWADVARGVS